MNARTDTNHSSANDWVAEYELGDFLDVVRFDDNGEPQVVDSQGSRLVPAKQLPGFVKLRYADRATHSYIPALPGWSVELIGGVVAPLLGWRIVSTAADGATAWPVSINPEDSPMLKIPTNFIKVIPPQS